MRGCEEENYFYSLICGERKEMVKEEIHRVKESINIRLKRRSKQEGFCSLLFLVAFKKLVYQGKCDEHDINCYLYSSAAT